MPNKAISLRGLVDPIAGLSGREKIVTIITTMVRQQYPIFLHFKESFITGRDTMNQNLFHGVDTMVVGTKQKKKYKVVHA